MLDPVAISIARGPDPQPFCSYFDDRPRKRRVAVINEGVREEVERQIVTEKFGDVTVRRDGKLEGCDDLCVILQGNAVPSEQTQFLMLQYPMEGGLYVFSDVTCIKKILVTGNNATAAEIVRRCHENGQKYQTDTRADPVIPHEHKGYDVLIQIGDSLAVIHLWGTTSFNSRCDMRRSFTGPPVTEVIEIIMETVNRRLLGKVSKT